MPRILNALQGVDSCPPLHPPCCLLYFTSIFIIIFVTFTVLLPPFCFLLFTLFFLSLLFLYIFFTVPSYFNSFFFPFLIYFEHLALIFLLSPSSDIFSSVHFLSSMFSDLYILHIFMCSTGVRLILSISNFRSFRDFFLVISCCCFSCCGSQLSGFQFFSFTHQRFKFLNYSIVSTSHCAGFSLKFSSLYLSSFTS